MFYFVLSICAVVIFTACLKSGNFFKSIVLSVFYGISGLFAVNFIGGFTGLHLAINPFSLLVSSISGLPGVIFLVVSDLILRLS